MADDGYRVIQVRSAAALERALANADRIARSDDSGSTITAPPAADAPPAPAQPENRDPREAEEWFQRLPEAKKNELRAHWQEKSQHGPRWRARQERRGRRLMRESALLLTIPAAGVTWGMVGAKTLPFVIPSGLILGAIGGMIVHARDLGRFQCSLVGAVGYALTVGPHVPPLHGLDPVTAAILAMTFFGCVFTVGIYSVWGARLEYRAIDGMDLTAEDRGLPPDAGPVPGDPVGLNVPEQNTPAAD